MKLRVRPSSRWLLPAALPALLVLASCATRGGAPTTGAPTTGAAADATGRRPATFPETWRFKAGEKAAFAPQAMIASNSRDASAFLACPA